MPQAVEVGGQGTYDMSPVKFSVRGISPKFQDRTKIGGKKERKGKKNQEK